MFYLIHYYITMWFITASDAPCWICQSLNSVSKSVKPAGTYYLKIYLIDKWIKFCWVPLQVLQERGESTSRHGRATFSVLLFQVALQFWHSFFKCILSGSKCHVQDIAALLFSQYAWRNLFLLVDINNVALSTILVCIFTVSLDNSTKLKPKGAWFCN